MVILGSVRIACIMAMYLCSLHVAVHARHDLFRTLDFETPATFRIVANSHWWTLDTRHSVYQWLFATIHGIRLCYVHCPVSTGQCYIIQASQENTPVPPSPLLINVMRPGKICRMSQNSSLRNGRK